MCQLSSGPSQTDSGLGGWVYGVVAGLGGVAFLALAVKVFLSRAGDGDAGADDRKAALGLFAFSIFYLFALFGALIVERVFGFAPVMGA